MQLYRFSPIQNQEELLQAITHIHIECHRLCKATFGRYLPTEGNIGVFCHYDEEFARLTTLRETLTISTDNVNNKYFRLHEPITIPQIEDIPATTYTYLYIRRADPYRSQVGDLDFHLDESEYNEYKKDILAGKKISGARIYGATASELDMIELYNPDSDALGYVNIFRMPGK